MLDILGSSFLFSGLSLAQISRLLDRAEIKTFAAGEVIYGYGDVLSELLMLVKGTVQVDALDGRSAAVGPGQHLGEALVLRPRPIRAKLVVTEPTTILALDGRGLAELFATRPWLGVGMLTRLVERLSGDLDRSSQSRPDGAIAVPSDLL